jgi:hypothetical protein
MKIYVDYSGKTFENVKLLLRKLFGPKIFEAYNPVNEGATKRSLKDSKIFDLIAAILEGDSQTVLWDCYLDEEKRSAKL